MTDLEEKFALIEKRVRALAMKNEDLASRVRELEQELALARRSAQELDQLRGTKQHVRERIENILLSLEAMGVKK